MAGKTNGLESTDWARGPTHSGPLWQRALKAIYDPDEKTFLGRTAKRWGNPSWVLLFEGRKQLSRTLAGYNLTVFHFAAFLTRAQEYRAHHTCTIVRITANLKRILGLYVTYHSALKQRGIVFAFYLVFYAVLALLFAICMAGLFSVLDDRKPTFILDSSLIGVNPGVAFRPRPLDGVTVYVDTSNSTTPKHYVDELETFLKPYANESWFTSKPQCNISDNYGFPESPCIFIKLNKIFGWAPDFFRGELPSEMSEDLVKAINDSEQQQVWISCWEENSKDVEIEYPWGRGLPGRFYPFMNENGYISPLLPVKFTPPVNTPVAIRCRAWAKNIIYNKSIKEPSGYARILLQIDSSNSTDTTEPLA